MSGREFFYPVERKSELDIDRLLAPERAIIIERRDALTRRNEFWRALLYHGGNEGDDRLLRGSGVPGRERTRLSKGRALERAGRLQPREDKHNPSDTNVEDSPHC